MYKNEYVWGRGGRASCLVGRGIQRVNDLRRSISLVNLNLKEYKNNQKL